MELARLTMPEFSRHLAQTRSVILPCGAVEEHGQHLPLATDYWQAEELALSVAARRPVFVAPPLPYGVCRSSSDHAGTVGIRLATLQALVGDLIDSFCRQGLQNIVIVTGHAGGIHGAALVDAGEQALERWPQLRVAVVVEWQLLHAAAADWIDTSGDSHAGEVETARIRYGWPDWQPPAEAWAEAESPTFPAHILVRNKRRFWPGGVWGDPQQASVVKGGVLLERTIAAFNRLLDELEQGKWDE